MITRERGFYQIGETLARQISQKGDTDRLAQEQARKIIRECLLKKFDGNRARLEIWLTGIRKKQSGQQVSRWAKGDVPGWVVLKIMTHYQDLRTHPFTGDEVKPIDPDVEELRQRIDKLLENKTMFEHLQIQIGICEKSERQDQLERDMAEILLILQKSKSDPDQHRALDMVQRRYGRYLERLTVHETPNDYRKTLSKQARDAKKGTPGARAKGTTKTDREPQED